MDGIICKNQCATWNDKYAWNIYMNDPFIIECESVSKDHCGMNFYFIIKRNQWGNIHKRIIFKSSSWALFIANIFYQEKYALVHPYNWYDKLQNMTVLCNRLFSLVK